MMAKKQKLMPIPEYVTRLMETIKCENPETAQLLMKHTTNVAHKPRYLLDENLAQKNNETVLALLMSLNPQDSVEVMMASQFVALHLKGMSAIAEDNYHIMGKAIMLIRLSQQALDMLQAYRGKSQTINVNYNVLTQGNTVLNTLIQTGQNKKAEEAHGVQDEF